MDLRHGPIASRRTTLRSLGLALLAASPGLRAAAQASTPVAGGSVPLLFLQSFASGSLAPGPASTAPYTLTLTHGIGWTLYFAERPARGGGVIPTETFLAMVAADPANPPNAAIVADRASATATTPTIWLVTLLTGVYDATAATVTYQAHILAPTDPGADSFVVAPAPPPAEARELGAGQLFIDPYNSNSIKPVNGDIVQTR